MAPDAAVVYAIPLTVCPLVVWARGQGCVWKLQGKIVYA